MRLRVAAIHMALGAGLKYVAIDRQMNIGRDAYISYAGRNRHASLACETAKDRFVDQKFAYKILRSREYEAFSQYGVFTGSRVDAQDGFIHLSFAGQLQGTLDKHYSNAGVLSLIEVDLAACKDEVKFETSRGGAQFPHLYGTLDKKACPKVWTLTPKSCGGYDLPEDIADGLADNVADNL